ncbi:MAG: ABC transporter permease [Lachnospiraceae bacterium]|nr:ABC transporter permease [Lachnospiraceae bacterium]
MNKKKDFAPFISSLVAIVCGLVIGFIILCISNPNEALAGFATILSGPITHGMNGIGQVLYYATPLILCGLSVGFAFKTGLFNIGGSGQFLMGAFGGVLIGLTCPKLGPFQWVVALLVATLLGALWGAIPGLLKAYFNVNEVITCIMLNYVSLFWVNMTVKGSKALFNTLRNESKDIPKVATLPKLGLDVVFDGASVNAGIIIAILAAILLYIILEKTTFGYELKACGLNKTASKYAGINENRSIVYSMVIAGAIAGLAGGIMLLSGTGRHIEIKDVIPNEGFNGISVALLGVSNPIGVIFSGLFIAYLSAGGFYLQLFHFSKEIIDIIVAVIIYFSAFALIIKKILANVERKKLDKNERQTSDVNNKSVSVTKKGV